MWRDFSSAPRVKLGGPKGKISELSEHSVDNSLSFFSDLWGLRIVVHF